MTARDKWTAELKTQALDTVITAVEAVADRIERGMEDGVTDQQYLLEDALWHLDQITGRAYARGARFEGSI